MQCLDKQRILLAVVQGAPRLMVLDLAGNAVAAAPEYATYAVFRLRALRVLDGAAVTAAQQAAARGKYSGRLTLDWLEDKAGPTDWARCAPGSHLS